MTRGTAEAIMRVFLPCYLVAYILIGHVYTVRAVRKKYGVDPVASGRRHPLMALGEAYRNVTFAVALLMVFAYAIRPPLLAYLRPIAPLETPAVRLAGAGILLGSLVLLRLAQRDLKGSWRVGFDLAGDAPELVTTGLYAWSRNPIYVAMAATGIGLFLALPNAVSLVIAALTLPVLAVRVRVEEAYLTGGHGAAYEAYRARTPRWF